MMHTWPHGRVGAPGWRTRNTDPLTQAIAPVNSVLWSWMKHFSSAYLHSELRTDRLKSWHNKGDRQKDRDAELLTQF